MCEANLVRWYGLADATDKAEGAEAYPRYHRLMRDLAARYGTTIERAAAVFVSLSPNNDYVSNLRSAITVLHAIREGWPEDRVVVSTYGHCRVRAFNYGTGRLDFLRETKGPKVRAFFRNIVDPTDWRHVTVDGHVMAAWHDDPTMVMKDALVGKRMYREIQDTIVRLAFRECVYPTTYQAAIWFARKRVLGIRYSPQPDIFFDPDDRWKVSMDIAGIKPYPLRQSNDDTDRSSQGSHGLQGQHGEHGGGGSH